MIRAILLDLDNTLLGNDMDTFLPRYFQLCGSVVQRHMPRDQFLEILMEASRTMVQNTDPAFTNGEVFWARFSELTGLDSAGVAADFDHFYRHDFEKLREVTQPSPMATLLVKQAFQEGLKVVVATNPMFPRLAIEARLAWAGVPVSEYDYALVTTMENSHATKPHAAYYEEILDVVDCRASEALMVGDDALRDIEPAASLGLHTYWVELPGAELPPGVRPTARGSLPDLVDRIADGWLQELGPDALLE